MFYFPGYSRSLQQLLTKILMAALSFYLNRLPQLQVEADHTDAVQPGGEAVPRQEKSLLRLLIATGPRWKGYFLGRGDAASVLVVQVLRLFNLLPYLFRPLQSHGHGPTHTPGRFEDFYRSDKLFFSARRPVREQQEKAPNQKTNPKLAFSISTWADTLQRPAVHPRDVTTQNHDWIFFCSIYFMFRNNNILTSPWQKYIKRKHIFICIFIYL